MQVHDFDRGALLVIVGRDEEGQIQADDERDRRRAREPRDQPGGEAQKKRGIGVFEHGAAAFRRLISRARRQMQLIAGEMTAKGRDGAARLPRVTPPIEPTVLARTIIDAMG